MNKKISLPDVTLIAATSIEADQAQLALAISSENIEFSSVKLLSSSKPSYKIPNFEHISIPRMDMDGYNRLMIKDLHKYFDTNFCLVTQPDGFIVNPNFWEEKFLNYDYIGAPWPERVKVKIGYRELRFKDNKVGNGGFSLRSSKLAKTTSEIDFDNLRFPIKNEDTIICHFLYKEMIEKGINFAPLEIAKKFAIEDPNNLYEQNIDSVFGFHGKYFKPIVLEKIHSKLNPELQNLVSDEINKN